jgi:hypothetical protein
MDNIERAAIRAEGRDPDDPEVIAALGRVRAELAEWVTKVPRWFRSVEYAAVANTTEITNIDVDSAYNP